MKIAGWDMRPMRRRRVAASGEPLAEDLRVDTLVAYKNDKRVLMHRVVKRHPDGREEVFIIKAVPQDQGH
jgi:hypothetical protein